MYRTVRFALTDFRPDIIHTEEEPDSLAALQVALAHNLFAREAKLVLHTWQNINRPKAPHVWWITKFNLKRADAILSANQEGLSVLREMGYRGITEVILQEGVNLERFLPIPAQSDVFTILYLGRLAPEKGLNTLFQALQQIEGPVKCLLVGDGPARTSLQKLASQMNLQDVVEFVGPVPARETHLWINNAHVLVLPSRTTMVWKEQFGRVLAESMACGVPVIGSDSGAIPEVIGDAGLIFPEGDANALAEAIRALQISEVLRTELSKKGIQRARRLFSQKHIADRTVAFYRKMVTSSQPLNSA